MPMNLTSLLKQKNSLHHMPLFIHVAKPFQVTTCFFNMRGLQLTDFQCSKVVHTTKKGNPEAHKNYKRTIKAWSVHLDVA